MSRVRSSLHIARGGLVLGLLLLSLVGAQAGRLIATPYAETLPEGRVLLWQFGLYEARTTDDWRWMNRVDVGLTDDLELGVFFIDPPAGRTDTWLNLQYRLVKEKGDRPTVSVGLWDTTEWHGEFHGQPKGTSPFVALGKTVRYRRAPKAPEYLKLSLGVGGNRLEGLFGGVDWRFEKRTGLFVEFAPPHLRLPNTEAVDAGVYHWFTPHWRARASWVGGNPMVDVLYSMKGW